jgi:hypothetical protein
MPRRDVFSSQHVSTAAAIVLAEQTIHRIVSTTTLGPLCLSLSIEMPRWGVHLTAWKTL